MTIKALSSLLTRSKKNSRKRRQQRPLNVQQLEKRELMTVDVTFSPGSELEITGDDQANNVEVRQNANSLYVVVKDNGERHHGPFDGVKKIVFEGKGGADWFANYTHIRSEVYGGDGNDKLFGGGGRDYIDGGDGFDSIYGGNHEDVLAGGDDGDRIYGGNGRDTISGGGGRDYIYGGNATDDIFGGDGNDKILGQGGSDKISGGGGDDEIDGGSGYDFIGGGADDDVIRGGSESDTIIGGPGNDWIDGEEGHDTIFGDLRTDKGSTRDEFEAFTSTLVYGRDTIYGSGGHDWLFGNRGDDKIDGGDGADYISGEAVGVFNPNDRLTGGAGNDTFVDYDKPVPAKYITNRRFYRGNGIDDTLGRVADHTISFGAGTDEAPDPTHDALSQAAYFAAGLSNPLAATGLAIMESFLLTHRTLFPGESITVGMGFGVSGSASGIGIGVSGGGEFGIVASNNWNDKGEVSVRRGVYAAGSATAEAGFVTPDAGVGMELVFTVVFADHNTFEGTSLAVGRTLEIPVKFGSLSVGANKLYSVPNNDPIGFSFSVGIGIGLPGQPKSTVSTAIGHTESTIPDSASNEDEYLVGDWDGDGRDDIAVRRRNEIWFDYDEDGRADKKISFGRANDVDEYLVGDWDGDGTDEIAVRHGNQILMDTDSQGGFHEERIYYGNGNSEDEYLVGDWDGDGIDEIAVRRGNQILMDTDSQGGFHEERIYYGNGNSEDEYLVGNWCGDRNDSIAVRRGHAILVDCNSNGGYHELMFEYGNGNDKDEYLVGNWGGDEKDNIAVRRGNEILIG